MLCVCVAFEREQQNKKEVDRQTNKQRKKRMKKVETGLKWLKYKRKLTNLKWEMERKSRAGGKRVLQREREREGGRGLCVWINDSAFLWYHFLSSLDCHKAVRSGLSFRHSTPLPYSVPNTGPPATHTVRFWDLELNRNKALKQA